MRFSIVISFMLFASVSARANELSILSLAQAKQMALEKNPKYQIHRILISYFRQEIENETNRVREIGLSFPPWFMKQGGIIQQKKAERQIAEQYYLSEKLRLCREFEQIVVRLEKARLNLPFFKMYWFCSQRRCFALRNRCLYRPKSNMYGYFMSTSCQKANWKYVSEHRICRFRPVLMTAIIGGLITTTLLTLFILPVLYGLFERGVKKVSSLPEGWYQ